MLPESKNIQILADNIRALENQINDLDSGIPSYDSTDEGKILSVDSSGELEWRDETTELPAYSSSDENKVLSVDSSGELEWKTAGGGDVAFRESTCTIAPKEGESDGTHLILTFDNETPIELLYSDYSTKKSVRWLKIEYSNGNWNVYSANQVYCDNTLYYFDELIKSQHYDALVEYEVTSFVFVKEPTRKRKGGTKK